MFTHYDTRFSYTNVTDTQTDGQTSHDGIGHAYK